MNVKWRVGFGSLGFLIAMSLALRAERPSGAASDGKGKPEDRPARSRVAPVWSEEDQLRQVYWGQFGEGHVTAFPVEEWLVLLGAETNPILWSGTLAELEVSIGWDVASGSVTATVNGTPLLVEMTQNPGQRPTWKAAQHDLGGFIESMKRMH